MTEIIILLNGNFAPIKVKDSDVSAVVSQIEEAIREGGHPFLQIGNVFIVTHNILGFYTRPIVEPDSKKMLDIVKDLAENMNDGEEWKTRK